MSPEYGGNIFILHHISNNAKKFILALFILSLTATAAFAEWRVLRAKEAGGLIELDMSRSKKLINNHVAFAREHLGVQRIEYKTEINCSKKKYKLLREYVRDIKGNIIQETTKPKEWERIEPGSVFEVLMFKLCQGK